MHTTHRAAWGTGVQGQQHPQGSRWTPRLHSQPLRSEHQVGAIGHRCLNREEDGARVGATFCFLSSAPPTPESVQLLWGPTPECILGVSGGTAGQCLENSPPPDLGMGWGRFQNLFPHQGGRRGVTPHCGPSPWLPGQSAPTPGPSAGPHPTTRPSDLTPAPRAGQIDAPCLPVTGRGTPGHLCGTEPAHLELRHT